LNFVLTYFSINCPRYKGTKTTARPENLSSVYECFAEIEKDKKVAEMNNG